MPKTNIEALLGRLLRVAAPGSALVLAACVTTEPGGDAGPAMDGGAATDAAAASEAGPNADAAPSDAGADAAPSAYLPFPEDVGCRGEANEFSGECCDNVACYSPPDGAACPDPASGQPYEIAASVGFSGLGSGSCLCGVTGPFDPAVANPGADDGVCCYIVTIQGCEGRPLTIAGRARFAPAIPRTDWT